MTYAFTHRDDPERTASLTQTGESPAVFVVEHTDAKGKRRKKSFKNAIAFRAHDSALRFLLNKEQYILRAPQDGPVKWMGRLLQNYRGEIGHTVDRERGVVWILDGEDQVHRIVPGTCETTSVALRSGNESPGGSMAMSSGGEAWCVAQSWDRVESGLVRHFRIYRIEGTTELTATPVADVVGHELIGNLSATDDGRALGPAVGGAALYDVDGSVLQTFGCEPGDGQPVAGISANGEWVACTAVDKVIRTHLPSGEEQELKADFKNFNSLQVADDGTVYVSGFRYPSHGLYVLGGEPERVSEDIRATISSDGAWLVEAEVGRITLRDPRKESDDEMQLRHIVARAQIPVLGMAKYGRAVFGLENEVIVVSDAYTVGCVDLSNLDESRS